jgi:chromosome segregation ATPase
METAEPFQRQLLYIAGEAVSLMPTGLSKGDSSYVLFEDFYKPPSLSPNDSVILKNTLRELFTPSRRTVYDKETGKELEKRISGDFLPPCDEFQKQIVLQSLQYRFELLRQKLNSLGVRSFQDLRRKIKEMETNPGVGSVEGRDSMEVRQNIKHFQALRQLIEDYEKEQQCINLEDLAFGAVELDLTDDRARELLKQFIFFTLQAHHPLEDYKKTSPSAPAFIKKLEVNPLGETFPTFLTTYQGNKLPIPEPIARVLDAINVEGGVLDTEVQARVKEAIEAERAKILVEIKRFFPDGDPFWRTVGEEKDISRILDRILEYYKDTNGEIIRLKAENAALDTKRKECDEMLRTLRTSLSRIRAVLDTTKKERDQAKLDYSASEARRKAVEEASKEYEARIARLLNDLKANATEMEKNQRRIQQLLSISETLTEKVNSLQVEVKRLQEIEKIAETNIRQLTQQYEAKLGVERQRTAQEKKAKDASEATRKSVETELANARAELASKTTLIEANTKRITDLEKAVTDCNTELETVQAALKAKEAELAALRLEKANLEKEKKILEEAIRTTSERANEEKEDADEELAELKSQMAALQATLDDVTSKLKACEAEKVVLAEKADKPTRRLAEVEGQLKALESQLTAAKEEKIRLEEEITKLKSDLALQEEVSAKLKSELDAKTSEASSLGERALTAEGKVADLTTAVETADAKTREKEAALLKQAAEHENQIKTLTDELKGQIADQVSKTEAEKARANEAEALVGETKELVAKEEEAKRILQDAIKELLIPGSTREAMTSVEDSETKENLTTILRKLEASSRSSSPSTAERRVENIINQCYNVMLLTYLWQTNFPASDEKSQQLVTMMNLLFSSGSYPGKAGQRFPGVYASNPLMIQAYLPLLLKLLTLFSVDGAVGVSEISLTTEEITQIEKLSETIALLEKAEMDAEKAKRTASGEASPVASSSSEEGSFLVSKARETMLRLNPQLRDRIPLQYVAVKAEEKKASAVLGAQTKLSYPLVFYCFMIVLRDHLNHQKSSLSRCPLPRILQKA